MVTTENPLYPPGTQKGNILKFLKESPIGGSVHCNGDSENGHVISEIATGIGLDHKDSQESLMPILLELHTEGLIIASNEPIGHTFCIYSLPLNDPA